MNELQALIMGVIQGLTEFFPISSTAHMRIIPELLGWQDQGSAFSATVQLGSLLAIIIFFRTELMRLVQAAIYGLYDPKVRTTADFKLAWFIAAGNIPIVISGLLLEQWIEGWFRSLYVIAFMLIFVAALLYQSEHKLRQGKSAGLAFNNLGFKAVMLIGVMQCFALIPGASRSGVTILGGLWCGLKLTEAARFSFLLGLPAILGSGLYELPQAVQGASWNIMIIALVAAFISSYMALYFLLAILNRWGLRPFIVYRVLLSILVLVLV